MKRVFCSSLSNREATRRRIIILASRYCRGVSTHSLRKKAQKLSGAPKSIGLIRDEGFDATRAPAFVRQIGCTRRVFLLEPYMSSEAIEGLAYRIKTLSKNDAINSVLIANDNTDDVENDALPAMVLDRDQTYLRDESVDEEFPPAPGQTYFVAGGYDPVDLYQTGKNKDTEYVKNLMANLTKLASAVSGDSQKTKVPIISIPHGGLTDGGGFCYLLASYVCTTHESCFRILHPSRGLSLDPVGMSYFLPRIGQEFKQASAPYSLGCAMILGLMGYEADCDDLLDTGLATNAMETPHALGLLEHTLSEIPPWNQQGVLKNPTRFHGQPEPTHDHNRAFRNVQVADTIHCMTSAQAGGNGMFRYHDLDDPSLVPNPVPWHSERVSELVNAARAFDPIFKNNATLPGILQGLRAAAARTTHHVHAALAADFVARLERQSPLAVSITHRLLRTGAHETETLQSCVARESAVQCKLLQSSPDFVNWAKHTVVQRRKEKQQDDDYDDETPFTGWKHKSIADVSEDEVTAFIESAQEEAKAKIQVE